MDVKVNTKVLLETSLLCPYLHGIVRKDYLFLITLSEHLQVKWIFTSFNIIILFDFTYLNV